MDIQVFIGWDSAHQIASQVCSHSILRRASCSVQINFLKLDELRSAGAYWRSSDPLASTEFTYSRFLTPYLTAYKGTAVFCDNDFLWLDDIAKMILEVRTDASVSCVKHNYQPTEKTKMDGRIQSQYPRKNWSSLMIFDCAASACRRLNPELVNSSTGAYLHQMQWADDEDIGDVPSRWNWLEGWNEKPSEGVPGAVHFTRGGPWLETWKKVEYADLWIAEREDFRRRPLHYKML